MIKTIELIVVVTLLIFSFFAGVKYSDSVKSHASWIFETKDEQEVELPDLSNEAGDNSGSESLQAASPQDSTPMDNIEEDPAAQPQTEAVTPVSK